MNEMVERVARVICAQWGERDKAFIDKRWHLQIPIAQAVIDAMREPTEAMISQGALEITSMGPLSTDMRSAADSYRAMIDEALKPAP